VILAAPIADSISRAVQEEDPANYLLIIIENQLIVARLLLEPGP